MTLNKKPLALAVSLAAAWSAHAAEPGSITSMATDATLATVVVVAPPEAELNSIVLDDDLLLRLRAATSDTASLLRDIPGVSLQGAGGVSSLPSIRGLADDRLRIKVDGMDLIAACPNHMNSALSYIDPTAVSTAQVYAGVTPVSVGGDSIGGSIVVESAGPAFAKPGQGTLKQGEVGAFYRSNGHALGGHLSATVASEQFSLNYQGSTAQSDNYTAGDAFKTFTATGRPGHILDLDEVGSSAYKSINQAVTLGWKGDTDLIEFRYGRQHIPYEAYPNQRMDMTDNVSDQFNLAYTGKQSWGMLKGRAYYEHTRHEMNFGDDKQLVYGTATNGMPMNTDGKNRGVTLAADVMVDPHNTLKVGTEYQAYRLDDGWPPSGTGMMAPSTFLNINDGQRDRYALFGEWDTRHTPQWTSLMGLRYEFVDMDAGNVNGYAPTNMMGSNQLADSTTFNARARDRHQTDHNWDLSALARYTPDVTQTYEAGFARKTRSPSLYERYVWSTWTMAAVMNNSAGDGNGYIGDIDLKPEVAHTLSLAADWHDADSKTWNLRVAPYYTHVSDYIDARCLSACTPSQFNVLKYINQSARLYGLDVSGTARLARMPRYGDFTLSGLMNYVRGENRDTNDGLYNIMPLNAKLALTQTLGRWTNTLEGQFVAAKDTVSDVRNEIRTSGYSLVHLRSSYEWKTVRLDLGVENLFDRGYAQPLGGAYVGQGTTMSINGVPWGIAVPGIGRTFYAGVNVKF
ncbi:MAG: TonB-dependent receptor [Sulfuriferula multivorans]|uniref:TonB-dependent receptor n=1 Tax=Sulfuriferula multivorans TaxID=1559896 RepID=A0A7C9P8T6_9PROT|nr:TonB-dependent receptor [Sulfuriferula multivorans]